MADKQFGRAKRTPSASHRAAYLHGHTINAPNANRLQRAHAQGTVSTGLVSGVHAHPGGCRLRLVSSADQIRGFWRYQPRTRFAPRWRSTGYTGTAFGDSHPSWFANQRSTAADAIGVQELTSTLQGAAIVGVRERLLPRRSLAPARRARHQHHGVQALGLLGLYRAPEGVQLCRVGCRQTVRNQSGVEPAAAIGLRGMAVAFQQRKTVVQECPLSRALRAVRAAGCRGRCASSARITTCP